MPGRLRVKLKALKGDEGAARRIEERLMQGPGVRRAQANPVTGSVLISFDDEGSAEADVLSGIAEALRVCVPHGDREQVADLLAASRDASDGSSVLTAGDVRRFFGDVNETVRDTTQGLELTLLVPLALVLLGVRSFFVSEAPATPRWYDFLWFGFGTFMMLNAAGVPPERAAEEAAEVAASL